MVYRFEFRESKTVDGLPFSGQRNIFQDDIRQGGDQYLEGDLFRVIFKRGGEITLRRKCISPGRKRTTLRREQPRFFKYPSNHGNQVIGSRSNL
jgi:hypothetical protein